VQIRVEGETLPSYSYIDISRPLTRAEEFIRTGGDYWTSGFLNVYLGTADGRMTAVSVAAGPLNYEQGQLGRRLLYLSRQILGLQKAGPRGNQAAFRRDDRGGLPAEPERGVFKRQRQRQIRRRKSHRRDALRRGAAQSVRFFVSDEPLYNGREIRKDERVIVK
jgi:hypothetical protein